MSKDTSVSSDCRLSAKSEEFYTLDEELPTMGERIETIKMFRQLIRR